MDSVPRKTAYDLNQPNLITIALEKSPKNDETEKIRKNLLDYIEQLITTINCIRGSTESVTCQKYDSMLQQLKQKLMPPKKFSAEKLKIIRKKLNDVEAKIKISGTEANKRSISEISSTIDSIDLTEDDDGCDIEENRNRNPCRSISEENIGFYNPVIVNAKNIPSNSSGPDQVNRSAIQKNSLLSPNKVPSMLSSHRSRDPRFQQRHQPIVDLDELENNLLKRTSQKENCNYADQNRYTQKTKNCLNAAEERYDAYSSLNENYAHGENMLNETLSTINPHHFPASIPVNPDVIDHFSQNSKENENIRAWEKMCKPAFVSANSRIPRVLGNVTSEPVRRVNEQNNPSGIKLSDFLSQQMRPADMSERVLPTFSPTYVESICPQPLPTSRIPTFVHSNMPAVYGENFLPVPVPQPISAPVPQPIPALVPQPMPASLLPTVMASLPKPTYQERHFKVSTIPMVSSITKNSSIISKPIGGSKQTQEVSPEPKSNIRGKLTQEIGVIHRAGDSSKIRGSLKILKQDKTAGSVLANDTDGYPILRKDTEVTNCGISPNDPRLRNVSSQINSKNAKVNVASSKSNDTTTSPSVESHNGKNSVLSNDNTLPKPKVPSAKQNLSIRSRNLRTWRSKNFSVMRKNLNHKKEKELNEQKNTTTNENLEDSKERAEFRSPLNNIYPEASTSKSEKSYGQKKSDYKIPKKNVFPEKLLPTFLNRNCSSGYEQKQNALPSNKLPNSIPNLLKTNCLGRKNNEPINSTVKPTVFIKKKKKKRKREMQQEVHTAEDSQKSVNSDCKHLKNVISRTCTSEVELRIELPNKLCEVEQVNETANKSKSNENASDSDKLSKSSSPLCSVLNEKASNQETVKKEGSMKYGTKKTLEKSSLVKIKDKSNEDDLNSAEGVRHASHINLPQNANGRPKINNSCSEQIEKTVSPEKSSSSCDTEKRDSPKPKSESFAFKSEDEFKEFKSRLVTAVPSLKLIVEDLEEIEFFPVLILKLDTKKFALAKELFLEFRNRKNSNNDVNCISHSHSSESNMPEEMTSRNSKEREDSALSCETTDAEVKIECNFQEYDTKKPPVSIQKGKSRIRNRELDRLHADIDMMKHTKNNILTSTGPRACRRQTPCYTDSYRRAESFEKSKPSTRCRKSSFLVTSNTDTDSDEEVLNCRVMRSKSGENDAQKSKCKIKIVDSEDDSNENKPNYRSNRELREKTVSKTELTKSTKPKSCPKSIKIKRYGAEAVSDYDTRCRSLSVVLDKVKKYDNEQIRSTSCEREQNSGSTTLNSSFSDNNDEADWCIDKTEPNTKKTNSTDSKSNSASMKSPGNEKITLKFMRRQTNVRLKRYQQGMKLGKRKRKKREKKLESSESDISELEMEADAKATRTSKSVVAVKEIDSNIDERIKSLPKRCALKGASDNVTLEIITIGMNNGEVIYSCRRTICDFRVNEVGKLAYHLYTSHKNETWDGECRICGINLNKKCDFIDALSHLVNDHMMDPLDQAEQLYKIKNRTVTSENIKSQATKSCSSNNTDLEEKIANLPKRNSLIGDMKQMHVGSIIITNINGTLTFACNPNTACSYDTNDIVMFANHLSFVHKDVEWTGWCHVCEHSVEPNVDLVDALIHVVNDHLTFVQLAQSEESVSEDLSVKIKEEATDTTASDEQEILDTHTQKDDTLTTNVVEEPPSNDTKKQSSELIVEPPPTVAPSSSVSRIRVRRFDGDRLSRNLSEPAEVPKPVSTQSQLISVASENENSEKNVPLISEATIITRTVDERKVNRNERNKVDQNMVDRSPEHDAMEDDDAVTSTAQEKNEHVPLKKQNQIMYPRLSVNEVSLIRFYKCGMLDLCSFTTDDPQQFRSHLVNFHKDKKKRGKKMAANTLRCLYCLKVGKTIELLIDHLNTVHQYCKYQCAHCTFRACRPVYVYWHLENNHPTDEKKIFVADIQDNVELVDTASRKQEEFDIPTLRCCHGCTYDTLSLGQFLEHMKQLHSQVQTLRCHLCPYMCFKSDDLIRHFNFHYIAEFQCLYCLRGLSTNEAMKSHLLHDHPHLYPRAIQRTDTPLEDEPDPRKKCLKRIEFDQSVEAFKAYLKVIGSSSQNTVTLHQREDSVTSNTVSVIDNSFLNQDHSYFINAGKNSTANTAVQNSALATLLTTGQSEECSNLNSSAEPVSASISNSESNPISTSNETNKLAKKTKIGAGLVIGLAGKDLFVCGMTDCNISADDYLSFKDHMRICDNARNTKSPTCVHCNRSFQRNINFFEHVLSHGVPRFYCTLCDFKYTVAKKVTDHMKVHRILKTKIIPALPGKDNRYSDLFLVIPDVVVGSKNRGPQKQPYRLPPPQMTSTIVNKTVTSSPVQQVTAVYSAEEVDRLLSTELFSQPIKCGICQYSSKVRTNMRCHMLSHDCGLPNNTDIINPVPRVEKTELMFNKMTNHAAYAVKNDTKKNNSFTKIEKPDEEEKRDAIIPAFVPRSLRFSCGAPGCNYVTQDEKGLKDHFEGLHRDLTYFRCPHCGVPICVGRISSHFRYHKEKLYKCAYCYYVHYKSDGIVKHHSENHSEKTLNVQVVRELEQVEIDRINKETKYDSGATIDKSATSSWKCMLCRSGNSISQNLIKVHCSSAHGIEHKFKCSLCSFSHDKKQEITSHLKSVHKSISLYVVNVYNEIEELNETPSPVEVPNATPHITKGASNRADFKAPSPLHRDSFKENTVVNVENNEKANEIFANIKEKNDLCVQPYANSFKCPKCSIFRNNSREEMQNHIYKELKYVKFVCVCCGMEGITSKELESHLFMRDEVHSKTKDNISKLTEDLVLEQKVQEALDYQQFIMKEMSNDRKSLQSSSNNSDTADVILVSSDDETSSLTSSRRVSSDSNCSYVFSETEGAAASGRKRNVNQIIPSPRKKVINNSRIASSMETKPSPSTKGPIKPTQRYIDMTNEFESNESKPTRPDSDMKCPVCSFVVFKTSQLDKHMKNMHEKFACLHCTRIFTGEKSLHSHIEVSVHLDNNNLTNKECIPSQRKVVHIICPHCPFRSIGNTYANYTEVAEHNRKVHPEEANQKDDEIEVEVDGGRRRKLASFEISRLQVEANRGISKSENKRSIGNIPIPNNSRKRRNVAVKSTARIPPSASSSEPPSKVKVV